MFPSVQCTLVQTEEELLNPGDFLILQPQPALCPSAKQLRVILPTGLRYQVDIQQGIAGPTSWSGNLINPILYPEIVVRGWRGWMQWVNGVSWLVANN